MRAEVELWKKQGLVDFENAKKNHQFEAYYVSVFLCQQAVEKILKSYYFFKKNTSPGQTHSLLFLATQTQIPDKYMKFLRRLTPEFVNTRYPDAAYGAPSDLYDKELSEEYIAHAQEVIDWLCSQMNK
ncbi:MAG: HEPN domain-containing protein [Candidatus Woesearchaeota archaeon]